MAIWQNKNMPLERLKPIITPIKTYNQLSQTVKWFYAQLHFVIHRKYIFLLLQFWCDRIKIEIVWKCG